MARRESGNADRGTDAFTTLPRSRNDRWLLGVCGGFAAHFKAPSWLVRLLWAVSIPVTVGLTAIAYLLLAAILPAADAD